MAFSLGPGAAPRPRVRRNLDFAAIVEKDVEAFHNLQSSPSVVSTLARDLTPLQFDDATPISTRTVDTFALKVNKEFRCFHADAERSHPAQ